MLNRKNIAIPVTILSIFSVCNAQIFTDTSINISNSASSVPLTNTTQSSSTLQSLTSSTSTISSGIYSSSSNKFFKYVQVVDSCNHAFGGSCLNVRTGPGTIFPKFKKLRNGTVLRVAEKLTTDQGDWYRVTFEGEKILDKTQLVNQWYISAQYTSPVYDVSSELYYTGQDYGQKNKTIYVNITEQKLYAYEGNELFMKTSISSGKNDTPSTLGSYYIFYKTPSRYMQSTTTSATDTPYDLPGVPFDMYFNSDGSAIHGTFWHNSFGRRWSHGCVNMKTDEAEKLYRWAPLGTKVVLIK